MSCKELVSGLGIFIALVGIVMSLIVTSPFLRHSTINGGQADTEFSSKKMNLERTIAMIGNILLVIGTLAQAVSFFLNQ